MKKFFLFLIVMSPFVLFGQKHDAHWIGGNRHFPPTIYTSTARDLFFTNDSIEISVILSQIGMYNASIAMSDPEGKLLFYTNGNVIASAKTHKVMPNGKGLNEGSWYSDFPDLTANKPYQYYKYAVVPDKRQPGVYYQIHSLLGDWTKNISPVLITKIDMNLKGGAGDVVYKNKVLYTDSVASPIDVIQHGNGVDWWIVLHNIDGSAYHTLLLERDSIVQVQVQEVPTFDKYPRTWTDTVWNGFYPIAVSTQGDEIVDNYSHRIHRIIDFDRCSGALFMKDTFETEIYEHIDVNGNKRSQSALGFTYSPNDRFIYATSVVGYMQWDLEAPSINASRTLLSGPPFNVTDDYLIDTAPGLFILQQGPDGKVYSIFEYTHHIIHQPDEKGAAADMCLASDQDPPSCFGVPYMLGNPHLPNYRLGPLAGSGCDTITSTVTPEVPHATLTVRPNPVRGPVEVEVTLPNYQNEQMELVLYDALGRPVHQHRLPAYAYIHRFDTSHLAPGVYLLQLRDHQRVIATERVVVME